MGWLKREDLTTTTTTIDGTNKKYASYHSLTEMIEREVSGVRIDGSSVIINGSKDLFGDVPAIIVLMVSLWMKFPISLQLQLNQLTY